MEDNALLKRVAYLEQHLQRQQDINTSLAANVKDLAKRVTELEATLGVVISTLHKLKAKG